MNWSNQAWKSIEPVFDQILELPFIRELMTGTLPKEKFLFYLQQDACYLSEYGKILAGIAARTDLPRYKQAFLKFAGDTISVEQALHEFYLCNVSNDDRAEASPTCILYTGYLHSLVFSRPFEVALAGVLPCFWIYKRAGDYILENQSGFANPYQQWIDTYGGKEFAEAVKLAISICDEVAESCTEVKRQSMNEAFILASKMEWMFWDSAWRKERWPV
ncbi:MAG: TenA family protein [Prolixibacteraceae bacterium]